MGGGLMQLVAYGAQDIYLTGNPQITFFKVVYRRHTNFSMETIEQTVNGSKNAGTSAGNSGTVTISRNGDLVHKIYVTGVSTDADGNKTDGNNLIQSVELEIGGQRIDKHTSEWMQVWNELTTPESKAVGLKALTGGVGTWGATTPGNNTGVDLCMVPLQFWFCRNPGLALPLIALQYHEVKLKFTWGLQTTDTTCDVFVDYIYLDTDERRRFAQQSHEYLIEQIQYQTEGSASKKFKLNFNHPVKELIWTNSTALGANTQAKLTLNGHDRFSPQNPEYFQLRQPMDHHTAVPRQNLPSAAQLLQAQNTLGSDSLTVDIGRHTDLASIAALTADPVGTGTMVIATLQGEVAATVVTDSDYAFTASAAAYATACAAGTAAHIFTSAEALMFKVGPMQLTGVVLGSSGTDTSLIVNVLAVGPVGDASVGALDTLDRAVFFDRPILALGGASNLQASYGATFKITAAKPIVMDSAAPSQARTSTLTSNINVYSFALKPEEHQPSGTCNFSRIDTAHLDYGSTNVTPEVIYAVNYNVLRIMSGMGGLAYSN
jgi:hypothetical protein